MKQQCFLKDDRQINGTLYSIEQSPAKMHFHDATVNVTLFGSRVFADTIKLRRSHTGLKWALGQWLLSPQVGNLDTEIDRENNM